MPRPTVATPAQVRDTISSLLREAGIAGTASAPSFRRAVSVRKVRERLGGGNPATIAHEINALEKDIVGADSQILPIPEVPADIAALMGQLWQAAVGVQLTEVLQLRSQAQGIADAAKSALVEEKLRNQVLLQELAELRAAAAELTLPPEPVRLSPAACALGFRRVPARDLTDLSRARPTPHPHRRRRSPRPRRLLRKLPVVSGGRGARALP